MAQSLNLHRLNWRHLVSENAINGKGTALSHYSDNDKTCFIVGLYFLFFILFCTFFTAKALLFLLCSFALHSGWHYCPIINLLIFIITPSLSKKKRNGCWIIEVCKCVWHMSSESYKSPVSYVLILTCKLLPCLFIVFNTSGLPLVTPCLTLQHWSVGNFLQQILQKWRPTDLWKECPSQT